MKLSSGSLNSLALHCYLFLQNFEDVKVLHFEDLRYGLGQNIPAEVTERWVSGAFTSTSSSSAFNFINAYLDAIRHYCLYLHLSKFVYMHVKSNDFSTFACFVGSAVPHNMRYLCLFLIRVCKQCQQIQGCARLKMCGLTVQRRAHIFVQVPGHGATLHKHLVLCYR